MVFKNDWEKSINGRQLVVWGTGNDAAETVRAIEAASRDVKFFISRDWHKKPRFMDKDVVGKEVLCKEKHFVVIGTRRYLDEVYKELHAFEFADKKDFAMPELPEEIPIMQVIDIMNKVMLPKEVTIDMFLVNSKQAFQKKYNEIRSMYDIYETFLGELCSRVPGREMQYPGYCSCCDKTVSFILSFMSDKLNWRQSLVCPHCRLNNRMRFVYGRIINDYKNGMDMYIAEQHTSMYMELKKKIPDITGSEYFGDAIEGGKLINGIRHEDIMNLSFGDESLDMVITQEILEHVSDFRLAFSEMFRVLRNNGKAIFTVPFYPLRDATEHRAIKRLDGAIEHISDPIYHASPLSEKGSLVYSEFSWDIFTHIRDAGFTELCAYSYYGVQNAHLGILPFYFEALK